MTNSLHNIIHSIASASNECELRSRFMDNVGKYFEVPRWGIYLFDKGANLSAVDVCGIPNVEAFVELYQNVGRDVDPVRNYVINRHVPAHEALVLPDGGWKQSELYKNCCGYYDHEHIMMGPIVGSGNIVGAVYFARVGDSPAFNNENLVNLGAICSHLSASLAIVRSQSYLFKNPELTTRLTKRELEIAELVAQGLTNAAIAKQLWITHNTVKGALKRMFCKLEVASRVEMVTKLQLLNNKYTK